MPGNIKRSSVALISSFFISFMLFIILNILSLTFVLLIQYLIFFIFIIIFVNLGLSFLFGMKLYSYFINKIKDVRKIVGYSFATIAVESFFISFLSFSLPFYHYLIVLGVGLIFIGIICGIIGFFALRPKLLD